MKALKENLFGIVLCLFELVVGVLLLINPVGFTSGIIVISGVVMLAFGVIEAIRYFRTDSREASMTQSLTKGILLLLAGLFCVLKTEWFLAAFPVLAMIYGVVILVTGVGKIQLTVDMLRRKSKKWYWAAINAAVSIVCAAIILRSPFTTTAVLWVFTGISLIAEGVLDVLTMIMGKKPPQKDSGTAAQN